MNASELIIELRKMPPEAEVGYLYDGKMRSFVESAWLSRSGFVVLCGLDHVVSHDKDRPTTAPTVEKDKFWKPKQ